MEKHWKFFFLTLLWSWILWTVLIILNLGLDSVIGVLCYIFGALAPSSVGILLARLEEDKKYWKSFINRITDFRRIKGNWYLIVFGLIPATIAAAVLVNYLMMRRLPTFTVLENYLTNPLSLIGFAVATFVGGPLFEELGWRGYALDHLTEKYTLIWAGLTVTFFWMVWHWPLFMVEGTLQSTLISESFVPFLSYNIEIFSYGILIVWIYTNNGKSILSAIFFHFSINFFAGITSLPTTVRRFETVIQLVIAVVILVYWKRGYLLKKD